MRAILACLCLLPLAGCMAVEPARMRLPAPLADAPTSIVLNGIGGSMRGRFRAGDYGGAFTRSEQRLSLADGHVRMSGHADFTIAGPAIAGTIVARCRFAEATLDLGIAQFRTSRLAFRCGFSAAGRDLAAELELHEDAPGLAGGLARKERRGEIALAGENVQFRSVHKLAGSPIEMANPIGYLFEQGGRPVGAVELNGTPRLILPPETAPGSARTLIVAAVAIGLLADPANSALGD